MCFQEAHSQALQSLCNRCNRPQEAAVVEACVRHLVERCGLLPGQLGVITPYAAQVALLSKWLHKAGMRTNGSGSSGGWDSQDGEVCLLHSTVRLTVAPGSLLSQYC